jgi:hypothetical protein
VKRQRLDRFAGGAAVFEQGKIRVDVVDGGANELHLVPSFA